MVSIKQWVSSFILLIFLLVSNSLAQAQNPTRLARFGLAEAYLAPEAAAELGVGFTRLTFHWDLIQPNGPDDWDESQVLNDVVQSEIRHKREIVAVLQGTPAWAANRGQGRQAVPDMAAWANFVERMVSLYQGKINYWVIWHEPDISDENHPDYAWAGTPEDYVQLLKTASLRIKQTDPTAQVHLAGLTYHWQKSQAQEPYLAQILEIISTDPEAAGHNFYFDAVGYHLYTYPREMLNILTESRSLLDAYRLGNMPIWVNEFNVRREEYSLSEAEQAAFIIQAFALLAAGGAERYQFATFIDQPPSYSGLLRPDNSRRTAFEAYRTSAAAISSYTAYTWLQERGIYVITLNRRNQTTTIVWNTASLEQTYDLDAIADSARMYDVIGKESTLVAEAGVYSLTLPPANCGTSWCPIGGAPRILIENGTSSERQALIPLASPTPTSSPLPTPTSIGTTAPTSIIQPTNFVTQAFVADNTPKVTPPPGRPRPQTDLSDPPNVAIAISFDSSLPPETSLDTQSRARDWPTILDRRRVVLLVVVGIFLFTFFYFAQSRLWHSIKGV